MSAKSNIVGGRWRQPLFLSTQNGENDAATAGRLTVRLIYVTVLLPMLMAKDMDAVFQALAHESRRRMLDIVKEKPGIGVGALASAFDVSRIAVMKHLTVLEEANLIISEKQGRARKLFFNAAPIQMIHDRWTTDYSAYWASEVTRLKYLAEARHESETKNLKGSR